MSKYLKDISLLFKYGLGFFLLTGLILAASWAYNLQHQLAPLSSTRPGYLGIAVAFQVLTTVLIVLAWRKNLRLHGVTGISLPYSAALVGINTLGKYAPGKILGSVARAMVIHRQSGQSRGAILASFQEQLAMLHSGFSLVIILLAGQSFGVLGVLLCTLLCTLSLAFIRYLEPLVSVAARLFKREYRIDQGAYTAAETLRYGKIFIYLSAIWLLSSCTLYFCVLTFQGGPGFDLQQAVLITCLAYLAGFIALFAPGGIGVRDGVMVGLLAPVTGLPVAVSVSALHRLITIALDMGLGCYSFFYMRQQEKPHV